MLENLHETIDQVRSQTVCSNGIWKPYIVPSHVKDLIIGGKMATKLKENPIINNMPSKACKVAYDELGLCEAIGALAVDTAKETALCGPALLSTKEQCVMINTIE